MRPARIVFRDPAAAADPAAGLDRAAATDRQHFGRIRIVAPAATTPAEATGSRGDAESGPSPGPATRWVDFSAAAKTCSTPSRRYLGDSGQWGRATCLGDPVA